MQCLTEIIAWYSLKFGYSSSYYRLTVLIRTSVLQYIEFSTHYLIRNSVSQHHGFSTPFFIRTSILQHIELSTHSFDSYLSFTSASVASSISFFGMIAPTSTSFGILLIGLPIASSIALWKWTALEQRTCDQRYEQHERILRLLIIVLLAVDGRTILFVYTIHNGTIRMSFFLP